MPKIKRDDDTQNATMSATFIRNCKNDIAKFGFNTEDYEQFLISVKAIKDRYTALQYLNKDIAEYREKYLKKNEYSIGDSLILDKFKILSSDNNGHQYETGYFAPRSFWDKIYSINPNRTYQGS